MTITGSHLSHEELADISKIAEALDNDVPTRLSIRIEKVILMSEAGNIGELEWEATDNTFLFKVYDY